MNVLRVSSKSNPMAVATVITEAIKVYGQAELQAIGAGAVNQTIKAIAIARGYLAVSGHDVICMPAFSDVFIKGRERTALRFDVKKVNLKYAV